MNRCIMIEVKGRPIAKKRPRFVRVGKGVRTYNPDETEEGRFLLAVMNQVGDAPVIQGPVKLGLTFIFQRPKGHFGTGRNEDRVKDSAPKSHTVKPDLDNLEKFVKDALNGYMWKDDAQVCVVDKEKIYLEPGDQYGPRTLIKVWEV